MPGLAPWTLPSIRVQGNNRLLCHKSRNMMMKVKISQNVCSGQATSAQRRAVTIPMATSEKSSHSAPEVPAGKSRRKPCIYVLKDHQQPAACSVHRGLHNVRIVLQRSITPMQTVTECTLSVAKGLGFVTSKIQKKPQLFFSQCVPTHFQSLFRCIN